MISISLCMIVKNEEQVLSRCLDSIADLMDEIIIVDTVEDGIRYKVGNGVKTFAELPYADQVLRDQVSGIVVQGYYYDGQFYTDNTHNIKIVPYAYKLYIDLTSVNIYYYSDDDKSYHSLVNIPIATYETAGIMKLYNTTGDNEDGTMTQKSITSEIAKKFVVSTGTDEDLIFTAGIE